MLEGSQNQILTVLSLKSLGSLGKHTSPMRFAMFFVQYFVLQDTDSDNDGTKVLALTCAKFLLSPTRENKGVTSTIIVFQAIKDKSSRPVSRNLGRKENP